MTMRMNSYPNHWAETAQRIRQLADWKCEHCGKDFSDLGNNLGFLDVHHIDGDKSNNTDINLVALCRSCHALIEKVFIVNEHFMRVKVFIDEPAAVEIWFERVFPWAYKRGYALSYDNKITLARKPVPPAQRLVAAIFGGWEFELPVLDRGEQGELDRVIDDILGQLTTDEEGALRLHYGLDNGTLVVLQIRFRFVIGSQLGRLRKKALRKLRHPIRSRRLRWLLEGTDPFS